VVEHAALAGHGIRGTIEPGAKATQGRRVSTGHRVAIRAGDAFACRRGKQGQAGALTGPRPRSCGGPRNGMPWSQRDAPTSTRSPPGVHRVSETSGRFDRRFTYTEMR